MDNHEPAMFGPVPERFTIFDHHAVEDTSLVTRAISTTIRPYASCSLVVAETLLALDYPISAQLARLALLGAFSDTNGLSWRLDPVSFRLLGELLSRPTKHWQSVAPCARWA